MKTFFAKYIDAKGHMLFREDIFGKTIEFTHGRSEGHRTSHIHNSKGSSPFPQGYYIATNEDTKLVDELPDKRYGRDIEKSDCFFDTEGTIISLLRKYPIKKIGKKRHRYNGTTRVKESVSYAKMVVGIFLAEQGRKINRGDVKKILSLIENDDI